MVSNVFLVELRLRDSFGFSFLLFVFYGLVAVLFCLNALLFVNLVFDCCLVV